MTALRSLEEHDAEAWERHRIVNNMNSKPLGIACPKCGTELVNPEPNMVLTSNPPKQHTQCTAKHCGYRGYALR